MIYLADSDDDLRGGKSKSNTFLDRPISDTSSPGNNNKFPQK